MTAEETTAIAMRLAQGGWWGGDPEKILAAPADIVMAAMDYEKFKSDYEQEYLRINREDS